jgi:tetratricopeptide (TPR) repeat protein
LRALNNLGCLMAGKGDFKKAIEYLQQAIQVKTDYAEARYNLVNALAPQGRFDEAVDQLHTVLRLKPNWPEPMNKLAFLIATRPEIKGRDVNEAVRLARRACELTNYRNTTFLNTLVSAYLSAGRVSEAVDTAEAALNIEPNSASAHRVLEAALLSGGYFKKAIVHIKRFLEIEPNNISAKNDLAWILATNPDPNIRNPSDAIRFAQEACNAINSKDPAVLDTLAAAYASGGRFAEAVDTARMAINLADAANKPQLKNIIQYHLTFYTQDKPYIEPAPK